MNQGTYPLAASMINQFNRLDQISNNLANINTNGFKARRYKQKLLFIIIYKEFKNKILHQLK